MCTSSISSWQACQDVDSTVAEPQGELLPESSKTTYRERCDLWVPRSPCDKTKLVFQKTQGHVSPTNPRANQGQGKTLSARLWFLSVKWSRHDGADGAGGRTEVLLAVAGGLDPELLKRSQTSIGVAWQGASCQDDLNHPNCRVPACSPNPQAEIWEQRLLLTHCLRSVCYPYSVTGAGYVSFWCQDKWKKHKAYNKTAAPI